MDSFEQIMDILRGVRVGVVLYESHVCNMILELFISSGILFSKEVKIGDHSRVDFLTDDGIAIEVKKGKPNSRTVARQVARYAESERVTAIILVSERGLFSHIDTYGEKRVGYIALSKNWGIAM